MLISRRRFLVGSLAALAGLALPRLAQADGPKVGPLVTPISSGTGLSAQEIYSRPLWFPQGFWKVVYIVGDVDNYGPGTADYIATGKQVATVLKGLGLAVAEFYPPNNRWDDIKAAAASANILI